MVHQHIPSLKSIVNNRKFTVIARNPIDSPRYKLRLNRKSSSARLRVLGVRQRELYLLCSQPFHGYKNLILHGMLINYPVLCGRLECLKRYVKEV